MTVPGLRPLARRLAERRVDLVRLTLRRLAAAPLIVAACTIAVFALAAVSPLDPVRAYLGDGFARSGQAQRDAAAAALDVDRPFLSAWWTWVSGAARGDLGTSHTFSQPVVDVIAHRLPWTLLLSGAGLVAAVAFALLAAAAAGRNPGGPVDRSLAAIALTCSAVPPFVFALLAVALFSVTLGWAPAGGIADPGQQPTPSAVARHMALPVVVLAASQLPWLALSTRTVAADVARDHPARAAAHRGLGTGVITRRHIAPQLAAPLAALVGARLPELIVGALIVEAVFSWPGLAAATVDAALSADLALLAAVSAATALALCVGSWAADAAATLADPRVTADA